MLYRTAVACSGAHPDSERLAGAQSRVAGLAVPRRRPQLALLREICCSHREPLLVELLLPCRATGFVMASFATSGKPSNSRNSRKDRRSRSIASADILPMVAAEKQPQKETSVLPPSQSLLTFQSELGLSCGHLLHDVHVEPLQGHRRQPWRRALLCCLSRPCAAGDSPTCVELRQLRQHATL